MYIIVVGGGKVGFQLAKELAEANHEVLVIEQDAEKAAEITDELGDIVTLRAGLFEHGGLAARRTRRSSAGCTSTSRSARLRRSWRTSSRSCRRTT